MNIANAKGIPMSLILEKIGLQPVLRRGDDIWYLSPFRDEKTASFHIHASKNIWMDFGESKGGDVVDFVCEYLRSQGEDYTKADALRWLRNMTDARAYQPIVRKDKTPEEPALKICKVAALSNPQLQDYLVRRGIPDYLGEKYLKQVYVFNRKSGKYFYALGLQNENGGYSLRTSFSKNCVAPMGISFIRGTNPLPRAIHIFEGKMDFLSALAYFNKTGFGDDAVILNSVSMVGQALPYIKNYTYNRIYLWLDNNAAGKAASSTIATFAKEQGNLTVEDMNAVYADHEDVNAWHMSSLGLKPIS